MKSKILFVGPISPPTSGPGIKNKAIQEWIEESSARSHFKFLNTYDFRNLRLSQILRGIINFLFTRNIILSVSKNGRFLLIPICFFLGKFVVLLPAGGSFDVEINDLPNWKKNFFLKCCKCISHIYVESNILMDGLKNLGFEKISLFPNPRKDLGFRVQKQEGDLFKLVFVSKIRERKGVLFLIDAVDTLHKQGETDISLEFYGPIDKDFRSEFQDNISGRAYINYNGALPNDEVQRVISEHNLFVLPTTYKGEGLPGALVEASFTGIPVLISDFRAAREVIEHNFSGYIIPMADTIALMEAILELKNNLELRQRLGQNLSVVSKSFDIDLLMKNFLNDLYK